MIWCTVLLGLPLIILEVYDSFYGRIINCLMYHSPCFEHIISRFQWKMSIDRPIKHYTHDPAINVFIYHLCFIVYNINKPQLNQLHLNKKTPQHDAPPTLCISVLLPDGCHLVTSHGVLTSHCGRSPVPLKWCTT